MIDIEHVVTASMLEATMFSSESTDPDASSISGT